jgi:hypothetical protein
MNLKRTAKRNVGSTDGARNYFQNELEFHGVLNKFVELMELEEMHNVALDELKALQRDTANRTLPEYYEKIRKLIGILIFESGMKKFPRSTLIRILYCDMLREREGNLYRVFILLDQLYKKQQKDANSSDLAGLKELPLSYQEISACAYLKKKTWTKFLDNTKDEEEKIKTYEELTKIMPLKIIEYLRGEKCYEHLSIKIAKVMADLSDFWGLFSKNEPSYHLIHNQGLNIERQLENINTLFVQMDKSNITRQTKVLFSFFNKTLENEYDDDVMWRKFDYSEPDESRKLQEFHEKNAVEENIIISISGNKDKFGTITSASRNITENFGYKPDDIKGDNITTLMSKFYQINHPIIIDQFFNGKSFGILKIPQNLNVRHVDGYLVKTKTQIVLHPFVENTMMFVAVMKPIKRDQFEYIRVRDDGMIDSYTEEIGKILNLNGSVNIHIQEITNFSLGEGMIKELGSFVTNQLSTINDIRLGLSPRGAGIFCDLIRVPTIPVENLRMNTLADDNHRQTTYRGLTETNRIGPVSFRSHDLPSGIQSPKPLLSSPQAEPVGSARLVNQLHGLVEWRHIFKAEGGMVPFVPLSLTMTLDLGININLRVTTKDHNYNGKMTLTTLIIERNEEMAVNYRESTSFTHGFTPANPLLKIRTTTKKELRHEPTATTTVTARNLKSLLQHQRTCQTTNCDMIEEKTDRTNYNMPHPTEEAEAHARFSLPKPRFLGEGSSRGSRERTYSGNNDDDKYNDHDEGDNIGFFLTDDNQVAGFQTEKNQGDVDYIMDADFSRSSKHLDMSASGNLGRSGKSGFHEAFPIDDEDIRRDISLAFENAVRQQDDANIQHLDIGTGHSGLELFSASSKLPYDKPNSKNSGHDKPNSKNSGHHTSSAVAKGSVSKRMVQFNQMREKRVEKGEVEGSSSYVTSGSFNHKINKKVKEALDASYFPGPLRQVLLLFFFYYAAIITFDAISYTSHYDTGHNVQSQVDVTQAAHGRLDSIMESARYIWFIYGITQGLLNNKMLYKGNYNDAIARSQSLIGGTVGTRIQGYTTTIYDIINELQPENQQQLLSRVVTLEDTATDSVNGENNTYELSDFDAAIEVFSRIVSLSAWPKATLYSNNSHLVYLVNNTINDMLLAYENSKTIFVNQIQLEMASIVEIKFILTLALGIISLFVMAFTFYRMMGFIKERQGFFAVLLKISESEIEVWKKQVIVLQHLLKRENFAESADKTMRYIKKQRKILDEKGSHHLKTNANRTKAIKNGKVDYLNIKLYLLYMIFVLALLLMIGLFIFDYYTTEDLNSIKQELITQLIGCDNQLYELQTAYIGIYVFILTNGTWSFRSSPIANDIEGYLDAVSDSTNFYGMFRDSDGTIDPVVSSYFTDNICNMFNDTGIVKRCEANGHGEPDKGLIPFTNWYFNTFTSALNTFLASNRQQADIIKALNSSDLYDANGNWRDAFRAAYRNMKTYLETKAETIRDEELQYIQRWTIILVIVTIIIPVALAYPVYKTMKEMFNDLKKILKLYPIYIIRSQKGLKMFLLKTSNGALGALKDKL